MASTSTSFDYSLLSWAILRDKFISESRPIEEYSYEFTQDNSFPKLANLRRIANKEHWDYLRVQRKLSGDSEAVSELKEEQEKSIANGLKQIEEVSTRLQFLSETSSFCSDAKSILYDCLEPLQTSLRNANWAAMRDPILIAKTFHAIVVSYDKLSQLQSQSLGLHNGLEVNKFMESIESKIDSSMSLEEVKEELEKVNDADLVTLLQDFL